MISRLLSAALAEETGAAKLDAEVERYLNTLPSAVEALVTMTKERPYGRSVAFAAGQVLLYLVDEDDLCHDREAGALGLLDDAYLIHACIAALRVALPGLSVPPSYEPPDAGALTAVRSLLPAGVPEALDRSCEDVVRVASSLYSWAA